MRFGRVVITGAGGFLGQHLVRHAGGASGQGSQGSEVLAVVHSVPSLPPQGAGPPVVIRTMADVLREPGVLDGADVLIHAAAIRHRHGTAARDYHASNVELVEQVLRAAAGRVGRFVLVSSVGVYGFPRDLPIRETSPYAPRTLYSQTKIEGEKLVRRLAPTLGLPYTIVRPTILYGPGDRNGMLDKLAAMLRSGRYRIVGSGENTLHHTHVSDAVRGIFTLASSDEAKDEDFILAGPETITLRRLSELVASAAGVRLPRLRVPLSLARAVATGIDLAAHHGLSAYQGGGREPPVNHEKLDVMTVPIAFDAAKARAAGFTPTIGYAEGVALTLRSHSGNGGAA
jgi:nucleoside-diphosphate-sugar epimerase